MVHAVEDVEGQLGARPQLAAHPLIPHRRLNVRSSIPSVPVEVAVFELKAGEESPSGTERRKEPVLAVRVEARFGGDTPSFPSAALDLMVEWTWIGKTAES